MSRRLRAGLRTGRGYQRAHRLSTRQATQIDPHAHPRPRPHSPGSPKRLPRPTTRRSTVHSTSSYAFCFSLQGYPEPHFFQQNVTQQRPAERATDRPVRSRHPRHSVSPARADRRHARAICFFCLPGGEKLKVSDQTRPPRRRTRKRVREGSLLSERRP